MSSLLDQQIKAIDFKEADLAGPRIAIVSDIHANIQALRAVLEKIDELGVDETICAGDTAGYYTRINETIQLVRKKIRYHCLGNHDFGIVEFCGITQPRFNRFARQALRFQRDKITRENIEWLAQLPIRFLLQWEEKRIYLVHGHPNKPFEYLMGYNEERTKELVKDAIKEAKTSFLVAGHTHVPFIHEENGKVYLNSGSVGQPRDKNPLASFAVLDLEKNSAKIHRVEYDIEAVKKDVEEHGLPKYLWERLEKGILETQK